jgi:hypothetical protein
MNLQIDLDNKCIKIDGVFYHLLDDRLVTYLKHSQPQSEVITTENLVDYVNKNSEPSEVSNGDGLDYEVVEYISDAGIIMATGKNDMRIKSVRRLSDGEIFSVGDNVCVDSNFDWKIESFTISRPNRISIGERLGAPIELNRINHWSNKKPSTTNEQKEEKTIHFGGDWNEKTISYNDFKKLLKERTILSFDEICGILDCLKPKPKSEPTLTDKTISYQDLIDFLNAPKKGVSFYHEHITDMLTHFKPK